MCEVAFRTELVDPQNGELVDFGIEITWFRPATSGCIAWDESDADIDFNIIDEDGNDRFDVYESLVGEEIKAIERMIIDYVREAKAECELELALG